MKWFIIFLLQLRCFAAVFKKSAVSQPSILFFYMIYFVSIFDLFSTIFFVLLSTIFSVLLSTIYFVSFFDSFRFVFNHFAQSILILSYPAMAWSCKISQISQMCKKFMVLGAKFGGKQVMIGKVSYMF